MDEISDWYCKIFVSINQSKQELVCFITNQLTGTVERGTITVSYAEIDVRTNEDFVEQISENDPDAFLHYRYYLDIEPGPLFNRDLYVQTIIKLLTTLRATGARVVAACDFEEELPKGKEVIN